MQNVCPNCGTVNRPGARFCGKCGVTLSAPPPMPAAPPPIPPAPSRFPPVQVPAPAAPAGGPNRKLLIALAGVLGLFVVCIVLGFGAYAIYQSAAATPTPGLNIKTLVPPIQSAVPQIQTALPQIQTKIPEIQTKLPLPTGFPTLPGGLTIPTIPGLPNLFATATPKP